MTFSLKQFAKFLYETKYLQNAISMYNVFVSIIKKKIRKKKEQLVRYERFKQIVLT